MNVFTMLYGYRETEEREMGGVDFNGENNVQK